MSSTSERSSGVSRFSLHALAALIVGGVLLFAFVLYLLVAFAAWLVTTPQYLVYAFLMLVVGQSWWILLAWLKRRFQTSRRRPET